MSARQKSCVSNDRTNKTLSIHFVSFAESPIQRHAFRIQTTKNERLTDWRKRWRAMRVIYFRWQMHVSMSIVDCCQIRCERMGKKDRKRVSVCTVYPVLLLMRNAKTLNNANYEDKQQRQRRQRQQPPEADRLLNRNAAHCGGGAITAVSMSWWCYFGWMVGTVCGLFRARARRIEQTNERVFASALLCFASCFMELNTALHRKILCQMNAFTRLNSILICKVL